MIFTRRFGALRARRMPETTLAQPLASEEAYLADAGLAGGAREEASDKRAA